MEAEKRTSGCCSRTVGATSSISVQRLVISIGGYWDCITCWDGDEGKRTGAVRYMLDDVPALKPFYHAPDEKFRAFRRCVDGHEAEGAWGLC